jgi:hypothetical protein
MEEEKKPAQVVIHKPIGGRRAKVVSPRTPGHGTTGVYFRNVGDSNALTLFGHDVTSTQQELVVKILRHSDSEVRFPGMFFRRHPPRTYSDALKREGDPPYPEGRSAPEKSGQLPASMYLSRSFCG